MKHAKAIKNNRKHDANIINHVRRETTRLNKFLSDAGVSSRRGADRLVESGCVTVNGVIATVGTVLRPEDIVAVNGDIIQEKQSPVYLALHKPRGITCTTDLEIEGNIVEFMNYERPIFPIGRLDKDSSGLILLTDDGDIVNKILREEHGHDKQYTVHVNKKLTHEFKTNMEAGVAIYNPVQHRMQKTEPCQVTAIDDTTFKIVLNQGLNLQIRRMCKALGYRVLTLRRDRIMNVHLDDLSVGQWRYLSNEELQQMNQALSDTQK